MLKKIASYWGDIIFYPTFLLFIYFVFFQFKGMRNPSIMFARYLCLMYVAILIIAIVRLTLFKKRALRDWEYLVYGIMPIICLTPFVFFGFGNAQYDYLHEEAYVSAVIKAIQYSVYWLNTGRFVMWLVKRHEKKRTEIALTTSAITNAPLNEEKIVAKDETPGSPATEPDQRREPEAS
jgi:O-antigen ligase